MIFCCLVGTKISHFIEEIMNSLIEGKIVLVTGKYFIDCRQVDSSPESYDKSVAEQQWHVSLNLTGTENTL
jgi:hypothetical protein